MSSATVHALDTDPATGYDYVLVLRPVRDAGGRIVDAVIIAANAPWRAAFAVAGRDPVGMRIREFPIDRSDRLANVASVIETGLPLRVSIPMPGDPSRQFEAQYTPDGGQVTMVAREVTRERRVEAALRESEARSAATLETLLDPLVIMRAIRNEAGAIVDFVYDYANDAACVANRVTREEQIGRRLLDLLPGHESAGLIASYARVIETGEPLILNDFEYEERWDGQGPRRIFDVRATKLGDSLVHTWRDVTSRREVQAALRASEERFRQLAENASDVVFQSAPDSVLQWVSPSALTVLGRAPEELVGDRAADLIHPDDLPLVQSRSAGVNLGGSTSFEARYRMPDGSYRWMAVSSRPLEDARGVFVGRTGVVRDVDAAHRAHDEVALIRARLEEAQRIAHVGSWSWDALTDTSEWSAEIYRIYGFDPDVAPVNMEAVQTLFPPASSTAIKEAVAQALADGQPYEVEHEFVRPNGSHGWAIHRGVPERGPDGQVVSIHGTEIDISEHHAAEAALRASEERYHSVVAAMTEGVVLQTAAGEITACNAAAERILGLTTGQMTGLSSVDPRWRAIHEDGSPFPGETHPAMVTLATGKPISGAVMGVHKPDGSLTWISINSAPLTMPGAALPYAVVATFADITERRVTAEAHGRTRRQLQAIIDATTDAVYVKDPDGRYLLFNRAAELFVGRTAAEVLGRDDTVLFTAEEAAAVMQADRTAMAQPTPTTWEESVTTASGGIATFLTTKGPLLAADGSLLGLFGVARDITERKRAEEVISASRTELSEAQRIAHVGSWRWNAASDIAYWSEEHYRIFGLDPSGPAPSAARQAQLSDPETYERARIEAGRAIAESAPFEIEYDIVRPDGQTRHVVVRGEPTRSDTGRVIEYRGTTSDVTELHEARKRLDQAQRAEMVGRLAGGVAHDFNNLLMAISGYAEFLAVGIPADNPLRNDVDAIRRAGTRAAELTHQLLAFGRRQTLRPTVFAANDVVTGLLPMLTSLVGDAIRIMPTHDGEAGLVLADRSEVEHAIVNLVLNARDAMPSGGRIGIATATETLGAASPILRPPVAPGEYVRITVSDTGTGMDPATMDHIFEPFFTTKALGQGTGLGLSSVDGAVAQSGGFVSVESVVGAGSSFSIFLPHSSGRLPARLPQEARQTSDEHGATILLVEDEPVVRAVTARLLRELGHTVIEAALPAEALEAVHPTVDLLVTDVMMPGMNGRELAERLVLERPGLPVIYISGYSPESLFGDGLLDAGTPFLAKPFSREELAARVQEALQRQAAATAQPAVAPPS